MIHEDERRTLEDWPEAKIITAKQDCELGNHYHKLKTEKFVLVSGDCSMMIHTVIGNVSKNMKKGELYTVNPLTPHTFKLTKGSVLIGLCSHVFDPEDDFKYDSR